MTHSIFDKFAESALLVSIALFFIATPLVLATITYLAFLPRIECVRQGGVPYQVQYEMMRSCEKL